MRAAQHRHTCAWIVVACASIEVDDEAIPCTSLSPLALVTVDTAVFVFTTAVPGELTSVLVAGVEKSSVVVAMGFGADARAWASASRSLCSSHDSRRTAVPLSSAAVKASRETTGPGQAWESGRSRSSGEGEVYLAEMGRSVTFHSEQASRDSQCCLISPAFREKTDEKVETSRPSIAARLSLSLFADKPLPNKV